MSIYFNTKKELFKGVLYNLGILLCKRSDVKDYFWGVCGGGQLISPLPPIVYRIRNVLYVKSVHRKWDVIKILGYWTYMVSVLFLFVLLCLVFFAATQ